MDPAAYMAAVSALRCGKHMPDVVYLHRLLLDRTPSVVIDAARHAAGMAAVDQDAFDVVKLSTEGSRLSLLAYPDFFSAAFPVLHTSWVVDFETGEVTTRDHLASGNPPVLHRKELLLPEDHPAIAEFRLLTVEAERAGLFADPSAIGNLLQWNETLRAAGLRVEGHRLVPREDASDDYLQGKVLRHRTAMARTSLSTPMQALWQHGYLDGRLTVFDYGCGRGGDVAALRSKGLDVAGWDPYFAPTEPKIEADLVNLGFVLNVIEDLAERREALVGAYALARRVLVVAVLIGGRTAFEKYRLFRDGVLTTRGTFQKYFAQDELREYIEQVLGREPIAIAPGMFFVFRTDEDEQEFLVAKQRRRLYAAPPRPPRPAPEVAVPRERAPRLARTPRAPRPKPPTRWEAAREVLDAFWARCLELGRCPEEGEFDREADLRAVGLPRTVLRRLSAERGADAFEAAGAARAGDLLVYLALNLFERRRSFGALPESVRRDIKAFWGSYAAAQAEATKLLYSAGKPDLILDACRKAADQKLGMLEDDHALYVHSSVVNRLPPVLRVYAGCAARLYGEMESADVVKIHTGSGKLTLMIYDDFDGRAIPNLVERVKVNLRRQLIDFFEYGEGAENPPQPLYLKSRFLAPEHPRYAQQAAFDSALQYLGAFDFSGFGPDGGTFRETLQGLGYEVADFTLVRSVPADRRRSGHG